LLGEWYCIQAEGRLVLDHAGIVGKAVSLPILVAARRLEGDEPHRIQQHAEITGQVQRVQQTAIDAVRRDGHRDGVLALPQGRGDIDGQAAPYVQSRRREVLLPQTRGVVHLDGPGPGQ